MTPPSQRGTRFPNLPKLPDPSAPIRAFLKTVTDLREQAEDTVEAGEQLAASAGEGLAFFQKKTKEALKKPLLPRLPRP